MPEGKFPDQGRLSMHKHPSMVGDVCESWPSADLLTVLIGRSFRLPDTGRGFLPTQDSDISDACSSGARRSRRVIHRQPARRAVDHPKHTPQAEKLRGYFCRHHRLDHPSRPSHPGDFLPTSTGPPPQSKVIHGFFADIGRLDRHAARGVLPTRGDFLPTRLLQNRRSEPVFRAPHVSLPRAARAAAEARHATDVACGAGRPGDVPREAHRGARDASEQPPLGRRRLVSAVS